MRSPSLSGILVSIAFAACASAQSNISSTDKFCWSENAGFINWRDANGGMGGVLVMKESGLLQGFAWCENTGYINMGSGAGSSMNSMGNDFGVNLNLETGALSGFAWSENAGWVNFTGGSTATPPNSARLDFAARRFRGYAWSENLGWINLDDANVFVALSCSADLNNDGFVEDADFVIFASAYNILDCLDPSMPSGCPADLNGDAIVEDADFVIFVEAYNMLVCP
ncbi:MAG: hypothetical protein J0L78_11710 [Planctomycetes bacterium]|nr:hypothetical protein [Planctomycetota bacterium]